MRRALALSFAMATLAAAPLAIAGPPEKVTLARKLEKGARLKVHERWTRESELYAKITGRGSRGARELEEVDRVFVQEVVRERPLQLERKYESSRRKKGDPQDKSLEAVRTSLHGRTVVIGPLGARIEGGGLLSREDRDELDQVEKLAYALLPKEAVALHDSWSLGEEVGRAALGPQFAGRVDTKGAARLDALDGTGEKRVAKLSLKLELDVPAVERKPALSAELAGKGKFLVEHGAFVELALEGPIYAELKAGRASGKSEGRLLYELKAEVLPPAAASEK